MGDHRVRGSLGVFVDIFLKDIEIACTFINLNQIPAFVKSYLRVCTDSVLQAEVYNSNGQAEVGIAVKRLVTNLHGRHS